ncbi:S24 family peptidase [Pantoea eucrina]|uniref:S24 family peptidase n=1 Tax=Pantoea eucrina TaxID=472693 RepID=UPI0009465D53
MGFPSPATDYAERKLSLNELCSTHRSSVYLFKSGLNAPETGIFEGSLLVVDSALKPSDGNVLVARIGNTFRIVRYRSSPVPGLWDLTTPGQRLAAELEELDGDVTVCFGVVTHCINAMRRSAH